MVKIGLKRAIYPVFFNRSYNIPVFIKKNFTVRVYTFIV